MSVKAKLIFLIYIIIIIYHTVKLCTATLFVQAIKIFYLGKYVHAD